MSTNLKLLMSELNERNSASWLLPPSQYLSGGGRSKYRKQTMTIRSPCLGQTRNESSYGSTSLVRGCSGELTWLTKEQIYLSGAMANFSIQNQITNFQLTLIILGKAPMHYISQLINKVLNSRSKTLKSPQMIKAWTTHFNSCNSLL